MKSNDNVVCGIDVHKKFLVAALITADGDSIFERLSNSQSGLLKLLQWLLQYGCQLVAAESDRCLLVSTAPAFEDHGHMPTRARSKAIRVGRARGERRRPGHGTCRERSTDQVILPGGMRPRSWPHPGGTNYQKTDRGPIWRHHPREIGNYHDFPSAEKLAAWCGIVPSVYQSPIPFGRERSRSRVPELAVDPGGSRTRGSTNQALGSAPLLCSVKAADRLPQSNCRPCPQDSPLALAPLDQPRMLQGVAPPGKGER